MIGSNDLALGARVFKSPLAKVDRVLIRMGRLRAPSPAWLDGCQQICDLPRHTQTARDEFGSVCFDLSKATNEEVASLLIWVIETLKGGWCTEDIEATKHRRGRANGARRQRLYLSEPSDVFVFVMHHPEYARHEVSA